MDGNNRNMEEVKMDEKRFTLRELVGLTRNKKLLHKLKKGDWPHYAWKQFEKNHKKNKIWFKWDWKALPPVKEDQFMLPAEYVIYLQSGDPSDECFSKEECFQTLLKIQKRDLDRGLDDIQYSFYIGGDGGLYEGRGFHITPAKDPRYERLDNESLDIAYMGDFKDKKPTKEAMRGAKTLTKYLFQHRYLDVEFKMIPFGKDEPIKGYPKLGLEEEFERKLRKREKAVEEKLNSIRKKIKSLHPDLENKINRPEH